MVRLCPVFQDLNLGLALPPPWSEHWEWALGPKTILSHPLSTVVGFWGPSAPSSHPHMPRLVPGSLMLPAPTKIGFQEPGTAPSQTPTCWDLDLGPDATPAKTNALGSRVDLWTQEAELPMDPEI